MALLPGGGGKAKGSEKSNVAIFAAIAGWYLASSLSNNTNKQILNVFPRPMVLSVVQLGCIALYSSLYLLYHGKMQVITVRQLMWFVLPLSMSNFCSHVFTYTSLKEVPVSFVHTVKATSPLFTVLVSFLVTGKTYSWKMLLSLLPVVIGVTVCTFSEASVTTLGIVSAFASTLIFVLQNVFSKRVFDKLDSTLLATYSAACACITNLPLMLWWEVYLHVESAGSQELPDMPGILHMSMLFFTNSLAHWLQNIMAFSVLSGVSPLTYSIMNTLKRLFVIALSIVWFGNPITASNAIGICIAISGVMLYNRAKQTDLHVKRVKKDIFIDDDYQTPMRRFGAGTAGLASATGSIANLPAVPSGNEIVMRV